MNDIQTVFLEEWTPAPPPFETYGRLIKEAANCTFDNLSDTCNGEAYIYPRYKLSDRYDQQVAKVIKSYNSRDVSDAIIVLPANLTASWWDELSSYAQCWCLTYDNTYREHVSVFLLTRRKDYACRFVNNFTKIGRVYIISHKKVNELIYAS
jgi:hypothetical protein